MFNTQLDYQICEYMVYCRSRQLRAKTMNSYEQSLRLVERWCNEQMGVNDISKISENILRRWLQFKDHFVETDYIFPVKSTGAHIDVNRFETNFKNYIKRVGLNDSITPHCLRNNFAKRCLMNGMDIYTLSRLLGHSSVTVTEQAYLDLTDEDLGKRYQHYSPVCAL